MCPAFWNPAVFGLDLHPKNKRNEEIMITRTRRSFLSAATVTATAVASAAKAAPEDGEEEAGLSLKGRIYKTLKFGMIGEGSTVQEKFEAARAAGFEGVELTAPGFDVEEYRDASRSSGLVVDGSVCAEHWQIRHSDPDDSVRAKALEILKEALVDTERVGGHTVLLVVGHGKDGTEREVWDRTVANIREAIPLAAKLGVVIAVENVWNHFCYDHEGGQDQTAEKFAAYIDEFDSPWVGMQFDIGNHWKYGDTGEWIRHLGKRIVKLDVKGFSRREDKFTHIGEGDLDFAGTRRALREIGFYGWCAAEVKGGNAERLGEISSNMDKALALA